MGIETSRVANGSMKVADLSNLYNNFDATFSDYSPIVYYCNSVAEKSIHNFFENKRLFVSFQS